MAILGLDLTVLFNTLTHILKRKLKIIVQWYGITGSPTVLISNAYKTWLQSVLRIQASSVRIQICGSIPLANGSRFESGSECGSGSSYFVSDLQEDNKNCFLLFEGTFTSFYRSDKKVGINVFLTILRICLTIEESVSVFLTNGSGWLKNIRILRIRIRNTGYNSSMYTNKTRKEIV
jgi:hypothetical protein